MILVQSLIGLGSLEMWSDLRFYQILHEIGCAVPKMPGIVAGGHQNA